MTHQTLPALPSANGLTPNQLAEAGATLLEWAEDVTDPEAIRDAANRWAAITEYVRRTSREGVAEAEAVQRRLELRVGVLLGPARNGGDRRSDQFTHEGTDIAANARSEFRLMAEHPDIVETVIAESSDASPPSRRKVIAAIRNTNDQRATDALIAEAEPHANSIREMRANLPDFRRSYLVTIRIHSHPDFIQTHIPAGCDVVSITEENNQ